MCNDIERARMALRERKCEDAKESAGFDSLVPRKAVLLGQYFLLTEELKGCLERKKAEQIGILLSRRQRCIEEVDKIDILLRKAAQKHTERRPMDHDPRQLSVILKSVESLDRQLIGQMRKETETLKEDLLKMGTVRGVTEKYRGQARQEPRFLNVRR